MNKLGIDSNLLNAISLSKKSKYQKIIRSPIKMLYSETLRLLKKPITQKVTTFWNDTMSVVLPEAVSMHIYRYGFFEEGLTRIFLEYLKSGMIFLDVGAHFGYFTLLGSYLVGKAGQVHSFEPTPSTFKVLKRNVSGKTNIFLNNLAVFSEKKDISLNDYGVTYSAFNSIYGARLPQNVIRKLRAKTHNVEAISIDEYVNKKRIKPNFIKIDAESAEYDILIGMEKTMAKCYPIITIEVGDLGVDEVHKSVEIVSFLIDRGYKSLEFKNGKIVEHEIRHASYKYENLLFIPIGL